MKTPEELAEESEQEIKFIWSGNLTIPDEKHLPLYGGEFGLLITQETYDGPQGIDKD